VVFSLPVNGTLPLLQLSVFFFSSLFLLCFEPPPSQGTAGVGLPHRFPHLAQFVSHFCAEYYWGTALFPVPSHHPVWEARLKECPDSSARTSSKISSEFPCVLRTRFYDYVLSVSALLSYGGPILLQRELIGFLSQFPESRAYNAVSPSFCVFSFCLPPLLFAPSVPCNHFSIFPKGYLLSDNVRTL